MLIRIDDKAGGDMTPWSSRHHEKNTMKFMDKIAIAFGLAYGLASLAQGYGFLAVFAAGVAGSLDKRQTSGLCSPTSRLSRQCWAMTPGSLARR